MVNYRKDSKITKIDMKSDINITSKLFVRISLLIANFGKIFLKKLSLIFKRKISKEILQKKFDFEIEKSFAQSRLLNNLFDGHSYVI